MSVLVMGVAPMVASAQVPAPERTFAAATTGMTPGGDGALTITIARWSTDAERDALLTAFAKDEGKTWPEALQASPTIGYVWPASGTVGYAIQYAQMLPAPDGGERVVFVTARAIGTWEREPWAALRPSAVAYPFSLVELRVNRAGQGEGKMSLAGTIGADTTAKAIGLTDYAEAPVLMKVTKQAQARGAATRSGPAAR